MKFSVPCPNSAKFLKVDPKTAVPVGRATTAPVVEQGVSTVTAGVIEQVMSLRVNVRSV